MKMAKCIKGHGSLLIKGKLYEVIQEFPPFVLSPVAIVDIRIKEGRHGQFPADHFDIMDI